MSVKSKAWALIVILVLASVLVSIIALPAAAVNADYSAPGSTNKVRLSASDLLLELFGDEEGFEISDEERAYLDNYSGESVAYSSKLPANNITSEYDVPTKTLSVSATEYTYTSLSGVRTVWTPVSVGYGEVSVDLSYDALSGAYVTQICDIDEGTISSVTVKYTTDIILSEATLNGLRTKAYNDAVSWNNYAVYLKTINEYTEQLALYKQYLVDQKIYDDKSIEYRAYLAEKAEYDAAKALFDQYEKDLAQYNIDYALYVKYLADLDAYEKNSKAYDEYVKNYAIVKAQLAVIDGTDKGLPTIGRPLKSAILGPTVTEVIDNKDAIANEVTGVNGSVIDEAGEATEMLRELFDGYFSKKSEADKYIYYSLNYEKFRDAFTQLLQTLDFLYQNGKVKLALGELDMTWKFRILLAQLYYVVVALNDGKVERYNGTGYFDSSYTIEKKKPITYLENVVYVTDPGTAAPISGGYPAKVEKPVEPTPVSEPKKPDAVSRPIPPNEIENPGEAPTPIECPTVPDQVAVPDKKYVKDGVIADHILALIDAYKNGKLTERTTVSGDRTLTLVAEASKSVLKVDEITVHFYDADGKPLSSVKADRGGYVEFSGKEPEKTSADKIYTFVGWMTADGVSVDMSSVNPEGNELSVYPVFTEEIKKFTVTWKVEDAVVEEEYEYGEIPEYSGMPTKDRIGTDTFVFVGWNKNIVPVIADVTYIAQFKTVAIVSDKNGTGADVDLEGEPDRYTVDCTANMGREVDLTGIVGLAAEEMKGLTVIFKSGTVILSFSDVVEMNNAGATVMSLSTASGSGDGDGASFKLSVTTPDGRVPDLKLRVTIEVPANITALANTTLARVDGDSLSDVPATITETSIRAQIDVGTIYKTRREFTVSPVMYADISLVTDKTACAPGDVIRVTVSLPEGARLVKLYYVGESGERVNISGGMFVMPAENITVGLDYEYITYTVRFTSDGRVIHTATYKPGEMPSFPGAPSKAADSDYTYTFVGWDSELVAVDGNAVYNAVYEKTLIEREAPKDGPVITARVLKIIVLVIVVAVYGGVVALPCAVVVIVKIVRRQMRKAPKKGNNISEI